MPSQCCPGVRRSWRPPLSLSTTARAGKRPDSRPRPLVKPSMTAICAAAQPRSSKSVVPFRPSPTGFSLTGRMAALSGAHSASSRRSILPQARPRRSTSLAAARGPLRRAGRCRISTTRIFISTRRLPRRRPALTGLTALQPAAHGCRTGWDRAAQATPPTSSSSIATWTALPARTATSRT